MGVMREHVKNADGGVSAHATENAAVRIMSRAAAHALARRAVGILERMPKAGTAGFAYAAIGALLLAAGALAIQTYSSVKRELTDAVMARRTAVAQLAAATLSERIDRIVDLAVSLGTRVRFAELVSAGQWEAARRIMRSVPSDFRFIERVVLYDVHGTMMADVPELIGSRGKNFAFRDWYQGVSGHWKPYVSEVYRRAAAPQRNVFAVAVPIVDRNAAPVGILQLQVHLEAFFDWTQAISLGAGGSAYVVDGKGTAAFHDSIPVQEKLINLSATPAVARLRRGKSGVEIVADAAGAEQVYSFVPGKYGWGVAMQQPASEVFAARDNQLRRLLFGYGLILVCCAAIAALSLHLVTQRRRGRADRQLLTELERRVAERTAALEAANKELEAFSYSVSHDLRAPLRAVDGYALMLEEDHAGKLDQEGWRLLGVVRSEAGRMGRLIDDLLAFSRTGRTPIAAAPLDMTALAREVADELAPQFPAARIDVASLPPARGDRTLFRQVWMNLLGNAVKYSSKRAQPRVEIGGRREPGGERIYWVKDNGAGFDTRYAGKLFQVFQRLHGPDEFEGTGIGLAIVRRVVERHGGRVWAEGEPDRGTTFHFALPGQETHGTV